MSYRDGLERKEKKMEGGAIIQEARTRGEGVAISVRHHGGEEEGSEIKVCHKGHD